MLQDLIILSQQQANYDADAKAYMNAVGTFNTSQKDAYNTFVKGTKNYGLWDKMSAMWGLSGGTSAAHKYNIKDPRDLDAAFRLTFFGGWTHNANGITANGSDAYAETYFVPSVQTTLNSHSIGFYSKTVAGVGIDFSSEASYPKRISMFIRNSGNSEVDGYNDSSSRIAIAITDTSGFYVGTRITSTDHRLYHDGVQIGTTNTGAAGTILPTNSFWIGRYRPSDNGLNSNKNYAFMFIGDGLSSADVSNLNLLVENLQTALGRAN